MQLDPSNQSILKDQQRIQLAPKTFAVLDYLRAHPGQLVTKDELLSTVWPQVCVGDAVLKVAVRDIRKVLGDDPRSPRFIETVHRRGYRFIGELPLVDNPPSKVRSDSVHKLAGRAKELEQLEKRWQQSLQGQRQIVFINGEPGVGKSILVSAWLTSLTGQLLYAKGQCLEQHAGAEAYLPVLDALGRLCRSYQQTSIKALLFRHAPGWLLQMPWLIDDSEREALRREWFGGTRERMLREMAEFLEALTREHPLILVFEDLHWSDYATLDLLAYLARREEPARLLVISTVRPLESQQHPLKSVQQELSLHGLGQLLNLDFFSPQELSAYLQQRCPGEQAIPEGLAVMLYRRTDGHPLFVSSAMDYLLTERILLPTEQGWQIQIPLQQIEIQIPAGLQQILERQQQGLNTQERAVLEAASVVRDRFSAAAVAAMLERDVVDTEEICQDLARHQLWLKQLDARIWPDGTEADAFVFIHSLYRDYVYQSLPAARRRRFHLRLALRLEVAYAEQLNTIVADLAHHFEQGRDYTRAITYLLQTARLDSARFAHNEAIQGLERAMELLDRLPVAERSKWLITLLERRNEQLLATGQLDRVIAGFQQLVALAQEQDDGVKETQALLGLGSALFWVNREACLQVAEQALSRSLEQDNPLLRAHTQGCYAHWHSLVRGFQEEHVAAYEAAVSTARAAGDQALECQHLALHAYLLTLRSQYDTACATAQAGLDLAHRIGDGHQYLICRFFQAWGLFYSGRWGEMKTVMEDGLQMAIRNGHRPWIIHFRLQQVWLQVQLSDYENAGHDGECLLAEARAKPIVGSDYFLSLIVLARAYLGQEQWSRAWDCLSEIQQRLQTSPHAIDWILRLPLQLTLSEYWQARQDWQQAREAALKLQDLAAGPMERTYYGLAQALLAEIALSQEHTDEAVDALKQAQVILTDCHAPWALCRVLTVFARCYEQLGDQEKANHYQHESEVVCSALQQSLLPAQ